MKRLFTLIIAFSVMLLIPKSMTAQTNIPLPNSGFENWSNGSSYSVTVLFFPLQVYGSYTYPTNWSYPSYPVNESITYSGINVNVNTNLPLLKVSNETSSVAEGSHALKMQTFMLSDIISSTVYNLAASNIDPELTSMVIPTILSTGVINLDNLLPILNTLMVNMSSIGQLMATFANEDINDFIDGGVALNGLVPGRLTGQYKYTSATNGDNGGILMLGTKYNATTHRRELVGGGYSVALTDASTYTNFEILYRPLSDILSTYTYNEPDSIAIFLFSSANNNRQQGSALYLDNLQLWTAVPEVPEDTCGAVTNLAIDYVDTTLASISWDYDSNPDHWEAEYGIQGFTHGNGITQNTVNNSVILSDLQPDTYYDVYVRSICNDSLASDWSFISFKTDTLVPPVIPPVPDTCADVTGLTIDYVDTTLANISWTFDENPDHWEVEYGEQGFTQGNGTSQTTTNTSISLSDLQPDTYYDVHVRSVCENDIFGDWAMVSFKTDTLIPPVIPDDTTGVNTFAVHNILCYPNPAHGSCTLQFNGERPTNVLLYSIDGKLLQSLVPDKETINLSLPYSGIFMIRCETEKGILTRKIVSF